jgi:branched-chain amino acid transport system substrate-binding protein
MRRTYLILVLGLIALLSLAFAAGCGDDDEDGGEEPSATEPEGDGDGAEAPGVTDTEIILGTHTSLTGPIAAYSIIPNFTLEYFNYLNDTEGGVNGRTITYLREDDQYSPPLAVDLTRKLVEQDGIFAMFNALGTPNHLQVVDYLQENGVPDMYLATGAVEWVADPTARPMVFGSNPNYRGEGLAIGKHIADNYAGQNVGVIYQNDDFGQDGLAGIELGVGDAATIVGSESYEVTDPDLNSQVGALRSADADVVVFFATPLLLGNAIKHARADLNWDAQFFISAVSMNELTALIAGPENIEGTMGPVATYMAYQTENAGIAQHIEIKDTQGIEAEASVLTLYAQYVAELMVETLRRADPLTRDGLVAAAEGITDWTCSVCLFPTTMGPDDHDPGQAIAMGVYEGGQVMITDVGYSWEGVPVDELSIDTLQSVEVPPDAVSATP